MIKHSGKPRSEKCWRRGLDIVIKLAAMVLAFAVPERKSLVPGPWSPVEVALKAFVYRVCEIVALVCGA